MTTIGTPRLVCQTIKGERDDHYAVVARQHFVALARAVGAHPSMVGPVAPDFSSSHSMTMCIVLHDLGGLPRRHRYPILQKVWQFWPLLATQYMIRVRPLNAKYPFRQRGFEPQQNLSNAALRGFE
jgi:hypothetical protein